MDKALKQRLVGASVLIALAVIVLPMLLSGRPDSTAQQTQKIELPPRPDELSFETRRFPVSEAQEEGRPVQEPEAGTVAKTINIPSEDNSNGKARPSTQADRAPEPGDTTSEENMPVAGQEESGENPAVGSDMPLTATPSASAEPGGMAQQQDDRYVIQVASLSSSENASRLATSLQEKGFPVLIDTVESDVGRLNRVRVGPFQTEAEAVQLSTRIGKEVAGVSPRIVDLLPDQASAVTNPADSLVRWVVQVGSFSDSSNAERVVSQLKAEGMSAYQETVKTSSSSIFRVRVGPFLEREEALRVRQLLSERLSIDGVVMSSD